VQERLPRLEVVTPRRVKLARSVDLSATVAALKRVDLKAQVQGVVSYLPDSIDIGRAVKRGEKLLELAIPDLKAEKANKEALLAQAQKQKVLAENAQAVAEREVEETQKEEKRYVAEVAYHKLRHARIRDLVRRRAQEVAVEQEAMRQLEAAQAALAANTAKVSTRKAKVLAAEAEVEVARRRIVVARAEVKKLAEMVGFATVLAPFDGVITRRWVDPGTLIKDPGVPLLTVQQIDRVRVLLDVPQRDVPLLNAREQNPNPDGKGDPALVRIPELAAAGKGGLFRGNVTRMSRSLDPVTRTMRAEVELDNRAGYLHPGMYGSASVLVESRTRVLTLPATAVVRRGQGKVEVFRVDTSGEEGGDEQRGVLRRVEVELGLDDGRLVEIKRGLKGNELIVARGNGVMRVDDLVIAVPLEAEKTEGNGR
jgi:RND family efflux transporter MFP subunit